MSKQFAASAASLCGLATHVLGWSPNDFWRSTPSDLRLALGATEALQTHGLDRKKIAKMMELDSNG